MKPVQVVTGTALPLRRADVDTDQIIPAEWLKRIERTGYEKGLFATWRDDRSFVLNDERFSGASILVAGPAFGVGSSREHAVWALQQYGFDAVIAPSFSDIFGNNCTKNGLVPVVVPGSFAVKAQAEAEGLDEVFTAAGFDWREPGCSMCLAMNPDKLAPGERSASTSNRNFEGRQGRGGRTHLVSPAVAAATAIAGTFATPADLED